MPELVDADITNKLVLTGRPGVKGTIDLLKHIEKTDDFTKTIRRQFVTSHMKTHKILLKYPLLSNPAPSWHADYISCERKNLKKQTISLYLSVLTGHYVIKKVHKRVKKLKSFKPDKKTIDIWINYVKKNNVSFDLHFWRSNAIR